MYSTQHVDLSLYAGVPGEKQTLNATVAYFIGCGLAEQLGKRTGASPQSLQVSVSPLLWSCSAAGAALANGNEDAQAPDGHSDHEAHACWFVHLAVSGAHHKSIT